MQLASNRCSLKTVHYVCALCFQLTQNGWNSNRFEIQIGLKFINLSEIKIECSSVLLNSNLLHKYDHIPVTCSISGFEIDPVCNTYCGRVTVFENGTKNTAFRFLMIDKYT